MMRSQQFIDVVLALAIEFNFSVTSWIRTTMRNNEVGGHPNSFHLLGLAVDCVLDSPTQKESFIARAKRLGLDAIDEDDHVHLEPSI